MNWALPILWPILCLAAACSSTHRSTDPWPVDAPLVASLVHSEDEGGSPRNESDETKKKNILAVFGGYTTERGEGGGTVGIDYERKLNSWLGVGGFAELVAGSHPASAFGAGCFFRPTEKFVIVVAPGVEFAHGESGRFLTRLGCVYDLWKWDDMLIAPAVYVDIFRGSAAFVLGFNFAWEF